MTKSKSTLLSEQSESISAFGSVSIQFTELYRRNVSPVYYYLYSRVQNMADAEDLTSQTFVTALETLHQLRNPAKFRPWVFSIARNKAMDFFRKAKRRPLFPLKEDLQQQTTLSQADCDNLLQLERLIAELKPVEQEYLRLRLLADLPFAEIANILAEPETRVKKRYYRLLERLQAQVEH
ncbi:MAG: RNA polymerase sigma factor [Anaerolineaceae bacterium]|nr:RNA polymerase sigma factor [Anaerolineaceae bacterium]